MNDRRPDRVWCIGGPYDGRLVYRGGPIVLVPMPMPRRYDWPVGSVSTLDAITTEYELQHVRCYVGAIRCEGWAYVWRGAQMPKRAAIMRILSALTDEKE